jgi:hypothetical protein
MYCGFAWLRTQQANTAVGALIHVVPTVTPISTTHASFNSTDCSSSSAAAAVAAGVVAVSRPAATKTCVTYAAASTTATTAAVGTVDADTALQKTARGLPTLRKQFTENGPTKVAQLLHPQTDLQRRTANNADSYIVTLSSSNGGFLQPRASTLDGEAPW